VSSGWKAYATLDGDQMVSVLVDMGMADSSTHSGFPVLVLARVPLRRPCEDGLEEDAEFELFEKLFDALDDASLSAGAMLVARRTGNGVREHIFYAREGEPLERGIRQVMLGFPGYACEIETQTDPDWAYFLGAVFPSDIDLQIMANDHMCEQLRQVGDDLDAPRPIEHCAYFGDEVSRQRFVKMMRTAGFSLSTMLEPDTASGEYGLVFSHVGAPNNITSIVAPIFGALQALQGRYAGWEAQAVPRSGQTS
jgi:hypothetical protein